MQHLHQPGKADWFKERVERRASHCAADAASEDPELDDSDAFDAQELLNEADADMNPELDTSGTDW